MPYAKNHILVKVPKRSGFDKSHRNSGTGFCGQLIPLLCDEVIPNSRVSLRLNIATQMPPLASDTYMNVKLKAEAFFVPMRLISKSFEPWFCDSPSQSLHNGNIVDNTAKMPHLKLSSGVESQYIGPGSLLDYLGFKIAGITSGQTLSINPAPIVAYHLIHQEYYRNPRVTKPSFIQVSDTSPFNFLKGNTIAGLPFHFFHATTSNFSDNSEIRIYGANDAPSGDTSGVAANCVLGDGHNFFELRQRNFGLDYFTGARVSLQQGDAAKVTIAVSSGTGDMTIAALRAANSLQQFRERNNLPSTRLVDQVKARYNANLADGVAQRPICIGSATYDMNTNGISQTAPSSSSSSSTSNIFGSVGAQYGRAYGAGSDFIIKDFTANEPGYVMVLISQVPEVSYAYGVLPMFKRYIDNGSIVEMANPILQNVGDQPIWENELMPVQSDFGGRVFGYQDRYADFMFVPNQVHGEFRNGQSLAAFVAQRAIIPSGSNPIQMSTQFLQIPKTYLDDVLAVSSGVSGLTYWYDSMLDYKVSMPLAEFSIPSLQDPAYEHGETVSLRRNGQIF